MRQSIFIFILGIAIIYLVWPTKQRSEPTPLPHTKTDIPSADKISEENATQTQTKVTQETVDQTTKNIETTLTSKQPNYNKEPHPYVRQIKERFEKSRMTPIEAIIPTLVPYKGLLDLRERFLFGPYAGHLIDDPQHRRIRLNLSHARPGYNFQENSCFALASGSQIDFIATIRNGQLRILRADIPGYLVFVVENKYYLELFKIKQYGYREYQGLLSIKGVSTKYEVQLDEKSKDDHRLTCDDI